MKVYQAIARKFDAYLNCQKASNTWAEKHKETIDNIMASAPSGSQRKLGGQKPKHSRRLAA